MIYVCDTLPPPKDPKTPLTMMRQRLSQNRICYWSGITVAMLLLTCHSGCRRRTANTAPKTVEKSDCCKPDSDRVKSTAPTPDHVQPQGGWIGIRVKPVPQATSVELNLTPGQGVIVSHLDDNGPAAQATVQIGDIWIATDGKPAIHGEIRRPDRNPFVVGKSHRMTVIRQGQYLELTVVPAAPR